MAFAGVFMLFTEYKLGGAAAVVLSIFVILLGSLARSQANVERRLGSIQVTMERRLVSIQELLANRLPPPKEHSETED